MQWIKNQDNSKIRFLKTTFVRFYKAVNVKWPISESTQIKTKQQVKNGSEQQPPSKHTKSKLMICPLSLIKVRLIRDSG